MSINRYELYESLIPPYVKKLQNYAKNDPNIPYDIKALLNTLDRSAYAYGIYQAALLAKKLKLEKISVIEFGVAGGNGLRIMEKHSSDVEKILDVKIDVYGFDTGEGLPEPENYRDMAYMFKTGNYKMDVMELKSSLGKARLILGNVKDTVDNFFEDYNPFPIGFTSFDLDYFSSTVDALKLYDEKNDDKYYLPRLFMYFDNIIGNETSMYNEFVGELAAIKDFNDQNEIIKIALNMVFKNYNINFNWYNQSFIMHRFKHCLYSKYIHTASQRSGALKI